MKKYRDNLFLIVFLLVTSINIFLIVRPKLAEKNLVKTISNYNKSKEYSFLSFDKDIDYERKAIYDSFIEGREDLIKMIDKYDLKIFISSKDVELSYKELLNYNMKQIDGVVGIYLDIANLIIVKDYNPDETVINVTESMRENATGDYKEFIKDKKEYKLSELYSKEEIYKLNKDVNGTVLYHEIGHFLVNKTNNELMENNALNVAYEEEKDLIFPKDEDSYSKSDITEYIAECISLYLNYGYVEYKNENLEHNSTKTGKIIKEFVDSLI